MAGISSLGIGSGVLTSDLIDKLKEADKASLVTPIENKITLNNQKQDAYTLLSSLMTTLKTSASALSYDTIFDNKTVDISGQAGVKVNAGANVDSFTLETLELAKKDITKFAAVSSKLSTISDPAVNGGAGTLTIGSFNIDYDATTTLSELSQKITDVSDGKIGSSILQTGDGAFSLVVSSTKTGAAEALTITDTGALGSTLMNTVGADNYEKIQAGQDAKFKYNGITTTRATNEISDLILGVDISLKKEGDFSDVKINQDTSLVVDEMQMFVDAYNTLMQNLSDMTVNDTETGAQGVFSSESLVKGIRRDLTNVITGMFNGGSLIESGISLDRSGAMSFDKSKLETQLSEDPDAVKLFFTGGTDANGIDKTGFFEMVDEKIKSYTGYGKMLSNFESSIKNESTNLRENLIRSQESLNTRYEIMTKRFTAYDGMISRLNSQFSSLQMMISAELNSND
ncbi:MAG: flagellar filament capping protein FliD [Sulfurimonas sp.]|uniref:flagellar filament capping protein FliD n=1 Tax=Sulfurimonas sp. TaxID=2022749 RepID=UPI0025D2B57D|nr:flagellar filament capping protein FliD [Sulfurimonas sp.]MCK9492384.1 flagellar filament capping protein FliD [Sulfurimonas sp.]